MITIAHGITGNKYVLADSSQELFSLCLDIGKSPNSIRWVEGYQKYVVRIKSKKHKNMLKKIDEEREYSNKSVYRELKIAKPENGS